MTTHALQQREELLTSFEICRGCLHTRIDPAPVDFIQRREVLPDCRDFMLGELERRHAGIHPWPRSIRPRVLQEVAQPRGLRLHALRVQTWWPVHFAVEGQVSSKVSTQILHNVATPAVL